jgi:hypothetical protein
MPEPLEVFLYHTINKYRLKNSKPQPRTNGIKISHQGLVVNGPFSQDQ